MRRDSALLKAGLNLCTGLKSGMTSYDDSVARLNSRHNLDELRILNSGGDSASVQNTGRVHYIYLAFIPRSIYRTQRNGDGA